MFLPPPGMAGGGVCSCAVCHIALGAAVQTCRSTHLLYSSPPPTLHHVWKDNHPTAILFGMPCLSPLFGHAIGGGGGSMRCANACSQNCSQGKNPLSPPYNLLGCNPLWKGFYFFWSLSKVICVSGKLQYSWLPQFFLHASIPKFWDGKQAGQNFFLSLIRAIKLRQPCCRDWRTKC